MGQLTLMIFQFPAKIPGGAHGVTGVPRVRSPPSLLPARSLPVLFVDYRRCRSLMAIVMLLKNIKD